MILGASTLDDITATSGVDDKAAVDALARLQGGGLVEEDGDRWYLLGEAFKVAARTTITTDVSVLQNEVAWADRRLSVGAEELEFGEHCRSVREVGQSSVLAARVETGPHLEYIRMSVSLVDGRLIDPLEVFDDGAVRRFEHGRLVVGSEAETPQPRDVVDHQRI